MTQLKSAAEELFTFHFDSIKTNFNEAKESADNNLHFTLILLKLEAYARSKGVRS